MHSLTLRRKSSPSSRSRWSYHWRACCASRSGFWCEPGPHFFLFWRRSRTSDHGVAADGSARCSRLRRSSSRRCAAVSGMASSSDAMLSQKSPQSARGLGYGPLLSRALISLAPAAVPLLPPPQLQGPPSDPAPYSRGKGAFSGSVQQGRIPPYPRAHAKNPLKCRD